MIELLCFVEKIVETVGGRQVTMWPIDDRDEIPGGAGAIVLDDATLGLHAGERVTVTVQRRGPETAPLG